MVPGHVRKWPDPQRIIGDFDHQRALKDGLDVPSSRPDVPIPIGEVGITDNTFWIKLKTGLTPFRGELTLALPQDRRGIHMSRIEEKIEAMGKRDVETPMEYAIDLLRSVLQSQPGEGGAIAIEGEVPMVRETPYSGKRSLESLWVRVQAKMRPIPDGSSIEYGVGLHHMTTCPCTQEYNRVVFGKNGEKGVPMPTHSQRSFTTLMIEGPLAPDGSFCSVSLEELVGILEGALHVTQGLLKRPDEAELVLKAHMRPQFVEDVVRAVARLAKERLGERLTGEGVFLNIETLSLESIHTHNVKAALRIAL